MKYLDFVSIDEKQLTELYCLIGISDWFAIVNNFEHAIVKLIKITNIEHLSNQHIGWYL